MAWRVCSGEILLKSWVSLRSLLLIPLFKQLPISLEIFIKYIHFLVQNCCLIPWYAIFLWWPPLKYFSSLLRLIEPTMPIASWNNEINGSPLHSPDRSYHLYQSIFIFMLFMRGEQRKSNLHNSILKFSWFFSVWKMITRQQEAAGWSPGFAGCWWILRHV